MRQGRTMVEKNALEVEELMAARVYNVGGCSVVCEGIFGLRFC